MYYRDDDDMEYSAVDCFVARLVAIVLLGILLICLFGCATHEPSSTDRHSSYPQVYCNLVSEHGQFHEYCCQGERCFYTY